MKECQPAGPTSSGEGTVEAAVLNRLGEVLRADIIDPGQIGDFNIRLSQVGGMMAAHRIEILTVRDAHLD